MELIIQKMKYSGLSLLITSLCVQVLLTVACSEFGPGSKESLVAELNEKIPDAVARGNSPSIQVAVVKNDQVAWSDAFGENTSIDHVYMNASVQKVFTATAIMQLVEKGIVDLDADVCEYVPITLRHPDFPDTPITLRMLLAHRSGLGEIPAQFGWDTESVFSPKYRSACPDNLLAMTHGEFLSASLSPEGSNYTKRIWVNEPGKVYHYSVSAYPFLRYLISEVTDQNYDVYMHENIFDPLGMTSTGFSADEFVDRHAVPYTRVDDSNVEIPLFNGQGYMMHTTAEDMAKFQIAFMNNGRYEDYQLLQPESIELMKRKTSRFKVLFKRSDDLPWSGHGFGLFSFRGGWFGNGGSVPGFQCLSRFNPSRKVGYVILSNVNAILSGGDNYESARNDIYEVQNALVSILDPTYVVRKRTNEILVVGALILWSVLLFVVSIYRRRQQRQNIKNTNGDLD